MGLVTIWLSKNVKSNVAVDLINPAHARWALAVAILSVLFEKLPRFEANLFYDRYHLLFATVCIAISCALVLSEKLSRIGLFLFTISIFVYAFSSWSAYHNHGWLSVWTIPAALAFGAKWWDSELYRFYLRASLGIAMLAACAQKVLAGTYLDGSFITFLSFYGGTTEQMFGFLCGPEAKLHSCTAHQGLGIFIVAWQAVVGVLLLIGVRNLLFLAIEIAFLLGAGIYADEMNFQVLNIALLCVGFGYGMRIWIFILCSIFLIVDLYGISSIINHVL
jgi:hypothetical protein